MKSDSVEYLDGPIRCVGYIAIPDRPRAGVLIAHEGPGLTDRIRRIADKIAGLGYIALAADLYGEGRLASSPAESGSMMAALRERPELLRQRIRAGFNALVGNPGMEGKSVGLAGYCFGGHAVLELARDGAPVQATVAFHGLLNTARPAVHGTIKGAVLACCGAADPFAPREQTLAFQDEMTAAGAEWTTAIFGGAKHAFTNPDADAAGRPELGYHEQAAVRSWMMMKDLFEARLSDPGA